MMDVTSRSDVVPVLYQLLYQPQHNADGMMPLRPTENIISDIGVTYQNGQTTVASFDLHSAA